MEAEEDYPKKFSWRFKTFGDNSLIKMLEAVSSFVKERPSTILTLSGKSEIGKTHLLKKCREYLKTQDLTGLKRAYSYPLLIYSPWEKIVTKCFDDRSALDNLENCGALLIEDFLSEIKNNSFTEAAYEIAYKLVNRRVGKFTIIETNKSEDDILRIDARIHSRLFREGGIFISVRKDIKPYLERIKDVS